LILLLSIYTLIHYLPFKALNSLYYADVPLRNYSLTHPSTVDNEAHC